MNTSSKTLPMSEVKKHNSEGSAWIIVHGKIYDWTRFLEEHPGRKEKILKYTGADCTEDLDDIHTEEAKKMLEDYRIGNLVTTDSDNSSNSSSPRNSVHGASNTALASTEKISCKLMDKRTLSHDVRLFRFAWPSKDQVLGLPVGKHIHLCATIDKKLYTRACTPASSIDEVGHFDLVVKIYFKGVHPDLPDGGLMSQYLDSLQLCTDLNVDGPHGHIEYTGHGNFLVSRKPKFAKKLAMLAGGTGITPIYQVIQAILKDPEDETEMYVVYANRTEDDILMRKELDEWANKQERLKVWYVISRSIGDGWQFSVGRINEEIMRKHLPPGSDETLALTCGPQPMNDDVVKPNLKKLNYDVENNLLIF